ncbi:MAG: Wzz/FepE/Etk N-terminal domain-containing protein [Myxococcota bacterium]|nr:Wzz/FepE/Etk N-terminal domain-containing protein [Myxococcota bacterium]
MNTEQSFQIGSLIDMLRRRLGLIAVVAGAVTLAAILVAAILPNQYKSTAILLIEPQTISRDLVASNLQSSDLNDRLHLIQMQILSRPRLSSVIEEFDVYPEESEERTREEVIEMMRDQIFVQPLLSELEQRAGIRSRDVQINTFQLSFRHRDKDMAASVANKLARSFVEENIKERTRASGDTSEFIRADVQRLKTTIAGVESRIAEIKSANNGSLPEDLPANQRLHERVIGQVRDAQRDLALAESDEAFYRQQVVNGGGDFLRYQGGIVTPERRLDALRLQLGEWKARGFTEKHPDIINARAEIVELEATIEEKALNAEDDTELSVAQQTAKAEMQRAALRAESSRREISRLDENLGEIEERLTATPRVQEQLGALEREWESLTLNYRDMSTKLAQAEIASDMERRQKGEKFRVLEEAVPDPGLSSPNRPAIVALGGVLGLALGLGLAVLLGAADRSFHRPRELQDRLGIPVLATVPNVLLASDHAATRRKRLLGAFGAAAVTGIVLVGAVAGNWAVNGVPGVVKELVGAGEAGGGADTPDGQ